MIDKRSDFYYTYQSSTGDNTFILPVNMDCIMDEYETFGNLPTVVKAPVLQIDSVQVDQQLKRENK